MRMSDETDLIIAGLEEGAELWKAEYDNCRAILRELVDLKNIKDTDSTKEAILDYLKRKPKAWQAAKQFLSKYQHL